MAMGLRFSGLGARQKADHWLFHLAGAAAGGAAIGATLGAIGALLSLGDRRVWVAALAAAVAIFVAFTAWGREFGRHRQVPRRWGRTMRHRNAFLLWGVLLGSGVATLIPYSSLLLLLGLQLAAGPLVGAAAGAMYGLARQSMTLITAFRRMDEGAIMDVLERFALSGPRANAALSIGGGMAAVAIAALG
jgi:hypothetical protein